MDEIFKQNEIGLKRDNKVRLVNHNKNWSKVFDVESKRILEALEIPSLQLFHCGSTAISGIVAKPIIDIVGKVDSLFQLDQQKNRIIDLGYEYKGEYGIKGRRFCILYNEEKTVSYCHLHIYEEGSANFENDILFRDYLNKNFSAAKRYEELKKSLNLPRDEYTNAKSDIINELIIEARFLKQK